MVDGVQRQEFDGACSWVLDLVRIFLFPVLLVVASRARLAVYSFSDLTCIQFIKIFLGSISMLFFKQYLNEYNYVPKRISKIFGPNYTHDNDYVD